MTDNDGLANGGAVAAPHRLIAAMERARILDGPAEAVARPLRRLFGGRAGRSPRGREPGHPLAVTLPIGAWLCSSLPDFLPGNALAAAVFAKSCFARARGAKAAARC
jgi:hypothetical protein